MRQPLTIAVAQPDSTPHDVAANAHEHAALVRAATARVIVFPELSLTGYELDTPAIILEDSRLRPIEEACRETESLALAGAPVADDSGQTFIAFLAIDGAGVRLAYRKQWVAGSEARRFSSGPEPAVLNVEGWRLGLAICRDTGIPRHQSDTAALGIDAYVAGTLMHRAEADVQNERGTRIAREHDAWVAFASFAGSTGDGYSDALGRSSIWAPNGELVAQAGVEAGTFARATLSSSNE